MSQRGHSLLPVKLSAQMLGLDESADLPEVS
jgi:hypothetical protein